jgi:hypothetical protein
MRNTLPLIACLLASCAVEGLNLETPSDSLSPQITPIPAPDAAAIDTTRSDLLVDTHPADLMTSPSDTSPTPSPNRDADLVNDSRSSDLGTETSPDLKVDTAPTDLSSDLLGDIVSSDLGLDTVPDLKRDTNTKDLLPGLYLGATCNRNSDCSSAFCTDGVCCEVVRCIDPCPLGSFTCTPKTFTCYPLGTCHS